MRTPRVSFVIPALDEAAYLPRTLESIAALETTEPHEVIVVDGGSTDGTVERAREFDVTVLVQETGGIGAGRDLGATAACGDWLAFVDADTTVAPTYLDRMLAFVEEGAYDAASSRCRVVGSRGGWGKQVVVNRLFPRLGRPILPGFNFFVRRAVYEATGGFPDVPNEDTAYSRALGRTHRTGYCPAVLVETSGRRFRELGLTGTVLHYARLDWQRLRAYP